MANPFLDNAQPVPSGPVGNPFQGQQPQPDPISQGASSVPNAAPSPQVISPAGTPGPAASGVPSPSQTLPVGGVVNSPSQPSSTSGPIADIDPDDILDRAQAGSQLQDASAPATGEVDPDDVLNRAMQGNEPDQSEASQQQQPVDTRNGMQKTIDTALNVLGGPKNWNAGLGERTAEILATPIQAFDMLVGGSEVVAGKVAQAMGGSDFGTQLEAIGRKMLTGTLSNTGYEVNLVKNGMRVLGFDVDPEPGLMKDIGRNTVDGAIQAMGLFAAAPKLAASQGPGWFTQLKQAIGKGAMDHPWAALAMEVAGNQPGSTIASEKTGSPTAGFAAGMAGAALVSVAANPVVALTTSAARLGIKLTTKAAGVVLDTAESIFSKLTKLPGRAEGAPAVSDDILDAHRAAEAGARAAGEHTVQAAANLRSAIPGTPQYEQAATMLSVAKTNEAIAVSKADSAWQAIPASVRNNFNQQSEAIRSWAADVMRPREFAQEQLNGDRQIVTNKISSALQSVRPSEEGVTASDYAQRISDGLQSAEKVAASMEGRFWQRAPLNKRMTDRVEPLGDLAEFQQQMVSGFARDAIPEKAIGNLNDLFSGRDAVGNPQSLPTLKRVQSEISNLGQMRRKELAEAAPNNTLVMNLSKLQTMGYKWIANSFPDNVPLQQAKEFSTFYHDNFSRSEVLPFLRTTVQGGQRIRPEDTLAKIMSNPHAANDIYATVSRLMDAPSLAPTASTTGRASNPNDIFTYKRLGQQTNFQKPDVADIQGPGMGNRTAKLTSKGMGDANTGKLFGPEDQQVLVGLRSNIENGMKAQFQEELEGIQSTPTARGEAPNQSQTALQMQKTMNSWAPRIKSFSDAAGEMQSGLNKALEGVAQRREIEDTALAKYFEMNDPQVAIQRLWSSDNPAAIARNLISGEAGVGGFAKDAAALEGFRAGLLDKLFASSMVNDKVSPEAILRNLRDGKISRLLDVGVGSDRMERLSRMADNLVQMKLDAKNPRAEFYITAARLLSLKASAMLPKIGEGAELMQASIFSQTAKKAVLGMLDKEDPAKLLVEAVRNPYMEKGLLNMQSKSFRGYTDAMRAVQQNKLILRRALRFGDAINRAYEHTQSNPDGDGPVDQRPPLSQTLNAAPPNMREAMMQPPVLTRHPPLNSMHPEPKGGAITPDSYMKGKGQNPHVFDPQMERLPAQPRGGPNDYQFNPFSTPTEA